MARRPADRGRAAATAEPASNDAGSATPRDVRPPCLAARGTGVSLQVSVMPNAKRTQADGLHDGALRVRLAAPPIDGRANDALVEWLADELGVPRRAVSVGLGASSRRKRLDIEVGLAHASDWLTKVLAGAAD